MNKVIVGVILVCVIAGAAYYLGYKSKKPTAPKTFELSTRLEPEAKLGVAYTDITSLVEVCPTDKWFFFKGKGRLLLYASNRYHYSLDWEPQKDIKSRKSTTKEGAFDLDVAINKIDITMSPEPVVDAIIIDKSMLVDEKEERSLLKEGMFSRLKTIAGNKLHSDAGKEALIASIKNHIYQVYASEDTKIDLINVSFSDDSLPSLVKYSDYSFPEECTTKVLLNAKSNERNEKSFDIKLNNLSLKNMDDGVRIYQWKES